MNYYEIVNDLECREVCGYYKFRSEAYGYRSRYVRCTLLTLVRHTAKDFDVDPIQMLTALDKDDYDFFIEIAEARRRDTYIDIDHLIDDLCHYGVRDHWDYYHDNYVGSITERLAHAMTEDLWSTCDFYGWSEYVDWEKVGNNLDIREWRYNGNTFYVRQ